MLIRHNILDEAKLSLSLGDVSKLVLLYKMEEYIIHILNMYITYSTVLNTTSKSHRKWFDIVAFRFYS